MLKINEIFGPTIQGEGTTAGQHCLFVRVAECNLQCTWCDTAYTWAWSPRLGDLTVSGKSYDKDENLKLMETDDVFVELRKLWPITTEPTNIIISGGEPLMQSARLTPLAERLSDFGNKVHIETAGTIIPTMVLDEAVYQYNVSPKLEHSGNIRSKRFKPAVLSWFGASEKAYFKFVVRGTDDMNEVARMVAIAQIPTNRVQIMPEGTNTEDIIRVGQEVVDQATKLGYGLSLRLHTFLWGNTRAK